MNRNATNGVSPQFRLPCFAGERFFDLFSGKALLPAKCEEGAAVVDGVALQPAGLGSILGVKLGPSGKPPPSLTRLLATMAKLTAGVVLERLPALVPPEPAPMDLITTKIPTVRRCLFLSF